MCPVSICIRVLGGDNHKLSIHLLLPLIYGSGPLPSSRDTIVSKTNKALLTKIPEDSEVNI